MHLYLLPFAQLQAHDNTARIDLLVNAISNEMRHTAEMDSSFDFFSSPDMQAYS
jgi:hypothetical protein